MMMDRVPGLPPAFLLMLGLWLQGCSLSPARLAGPDAQETVVDLATATLRVDLAIDAANACIGDYVRRYDSPTITPGDVLDAALAECRAFFDAHRAAVHALMLAERQSAGNRQAVRAGEEAEHHAANFRRIVRETGLAVLVQRRSAASSLLPHAEEGEIQL